MTREGCIAIVLSMHTLLRIIAIVVLLTVTTMFTGLETAFSAVSAAKAEKSCCDGCNHDEDRDSSPTPPSAPDCPVFMCLSFDVVEPVTLQVISTEIIPSFAFITEPIPDPFIKSIFHPPSLV